MVCVEINSGNETLFRKRFVKGGGSQWEVVYIMGLQCTAVDNNRTFLAKQLFTPLFSAQHTVKFN